LETLVSLNLPIVERISDSGLPAPATISFPSGTTVWISWQKLVLIEIREISFESPHSISVEPVWLGIYLITITYNGDESNAQG
jgi:hypothetical protein